MDSEDEPLSDVRARLIGDGELRKVGRNRGLLSKVTNKWREEEPEFPDAVKDESFWQMVWPSGAPTEKSPDTIKRKFWQRWPRTLLSLLHARRPRRALCMLFLLVIVIVTIVHYVRAPRRIDWDLSGFLRAQEKGTFGIADGGDFDGTFLKELSSDVLPGGPLDPKGQRRLIFVGDIHGCRSELQALLRKAKFDPAKDHIIAVGDVVSKGPDNAGVVDELIKHNAQSVRGNHEDRILSIASSLHPDSHTSVQGDKLSQLLPPVEAGVTSKNYFDDATVLRVLKQEHIRYLKRMPLMLRIPPLPLAVAEAKKSASVISSEIVVVHAGLVPHVPLLRQEPYFVMNMRTIDRDTHVPSALRQPRGGHFQPWSHTWNWYCDRVDRGKSLTKFYDFTRGGPPFVPKPKRKSANGKGASLKEATHRAKGKLAEVMDDALDTAKQALGKNKKVRPITVVYGHDSHSGLKLSRWSKGLDTGCVKGGHLTGLILDATGHTRLVQEVCREH
ncbi:Metallo-dependent phosphatase [Piedraia hortae CBS 480.64]|uniref:Metallo-dependent phosphatase n=1 Tax=Piedraia hortae CBS 480.64 TaxID=1314780 RepID=A0A6A7C5Q9_9PEZI|nr:Metallo-dependent phosphatase [Piedraia hortae CBS 480.64]